MLVWIFTMALANFGQAHASARESEVAWLDKSLAHFLITPHAHQSLYVEAMAPPTTPFFRENVFRVDRRRFGPDAPVKRFMMEEFAAAVESYFVDSAKTKKMMKELAGILNRENLPVRLTPEEFQGFLRTPRSKRFAPLSGLKMTGYGPARVYGKMTGRLGLRTVREAIVSLRDPGLDSLSQLDLEEREAIQQAIDDLLAADGDWEFCDRRLANLKHVPEDYLGRMGYKLD